MNITYNKSGVPLMMESSNIIATTDGAPAKPVVMDPQFSFYYSRYEVNGVEILPWGWNNDQPDKANEACKNVGVLNAGLKFMRNFLVGQGVFACNVDGVDADGNEIIVPVADKSIQDMLDSYIIRRYMEESLRDKLKIGTAFVQFVPSAIGTIHGLNVINARYCRISRIKPNNVRTVIVSGKWPYIPGNYDPDYRMYDLLWDYDPYLDLSLKDFTKQKDGAVMMLRDSWSNDDGYAEPPWWPVMNAGWIDIAQEVPRYLKKAYKHRVTLKFHIQIPYSYWDKQFPESDYTSTNDRKAAIQLFMDKVEQNLCGSENADKPLFTNYAINEANGKIEEEWKITPIDFKAGDSENLVNSAAANSEILFSLLINPNVMGAGMPGGTYAGNQGGSNIREAFLVNIANSWIDRQQLFDPIEFMLKFNGKKDFQIRSRNTVLTTLDTGAGTKKIVS